MNDKRDEQKLPLSDEAKARKKWRGGETIIDSGGEDTSLPASEVDGAAIGGQSGSHVAHDGRPGTGRPGNFPPPD
jgi:hypothetical protein